jgi:G2/mitotic-specific cyclin 2
LRGTAKSGTTAATAATAGPSKPTASAATLDANLQHKRKREALGEVTNNNKNKGIGKGIQKDGNTAKPHVLIATRPVRPTIKAPPRKIRAASAIPPKESDNQDEQGLELDEDAMIVDEPAAGPAPHPTLHRVTRRVTTRASTAHASAPTARRLTKNSNADDDVDKEQVEDEDTQRAFKRRRTSSEADVEAVVETQAEVEASPEKDGVVSKHEPEADAPASPTNEEADDAAVTGWVDLDKDDFDDPYMVSEYVVDIFKYLSECEVSNHIIMETPI